jgi:polar amino acid transport system substrate-binding protein
MAIVQEEVRFIMKKALSLVLAAITLLSVMLCSVGCGNNEDSEARAAYDKFASAYTVENPDGDLIVATSPDFSPMEFVDTSKKDQDQYVGFDILLAKYIAMKLNKNLVIKPLDFAACQTAVYTGSVDLSISGYSKTDERVENYELSDFYYAGDNETEQTLLVAADKAGTFSSVDDFNGLKVGAQNGSLQQNLVNAQLVPAGASIELYTDLGTAVLALQDGKIDALAVAVGNGKSIIANNSSVDFSGFFFDIDDDEKNNVIMIKKGNTDLLDQVNAVLAEAYEEGLYGQWYEACQVLAGIKSAAEISYDKDGNIIVSE